MPIATIQSPSHGFSLQVNNLQDTKKRREKVWTEANQSFIFWKGPN